MIWALTVNDACAERWKAGRAERGLSPEAPFEGEPLEEAYEEALDLVNYLRVAGLSCLSEEARAFAERIQALLQSRTAQDSLRAQGFAATD